MKIIYTAIFGAYDELKEPLVITEGVRYICFTDQVLNSKHWELIMISNKYDSARNARKIKTCIHKYFPSFGQAIWIDANQQINCDLNFLFSDHDFTLMKHAERDCVYAEADECLRLKKDATYLISPQVYKYKIAHYPINNGLVATGLMIRKNTKQINKFCEEWFKEIETESCRDQLSFNYVLWKNPIPINLIPFETLTTNFIRSKHNG